MILGFKPQFVEHILNGTKIHTIRIDQHNRWKKGNIIHFSAGVRTKKQKNFLISMCQSVQKIQMEFYKTEYNDTITIDNCRLTYDKLDRLALNDGFKNYTEFRNWFINLKIPSDIIYGKIIHWTGLKY